MKKFPLQRNVKLQIHSRTELVDQNSENAIPLNQDWGPVTKATVMRPCQKR